MSDPCTCVGDFFLRSIGVTLIQRHCRAGKKEITLESDISR